MKNLKISQKLLLGFSIVLVMLLIAAATAFFNMSKINSQVEQYATLTVPNNNAVWQMRRDMISLQRYLLMALYEDNDKLISESLAVCDADAANISSVLTEYLKTTRADEAKLKQFQENSEKVGPIRQQIIDLIRKNNAEDNEKAYKIFEEQYKPVLDESANILAEIGDFQNQRADQQKLDAANAFSTAIWLLVIVIIAAIAITVAVILIITKAILTPVKQVQGASLAISQGDLDTTVEYDGKDELGVMAENMRTTMDTLKTIIGDVDMLLNAMGNGDFTIKSSCAQRYVGQYKNILLAAQNINTSLTDTLTQINVSSDQVSSGSDQVSSGAQALSQGATEQASAVEELSASITEISEQVRHNAQNAANAKSISLEAAREVESGNTKMKHMITAMGEISDKSSEISKIIKTIDDIAFQTNILALNAAVEAARAGAAGKGFAVVADEVRNLAGKSAEAAKSTTALIEDSINAVANGTDIAAETAKSLASIVDSTAKSTELIEAIANASADQATSIAQVTQGVEQISSVVQTNSATAEESAAASEELSGQAQMLKGLVSRFKLNTNEQADSFSAAHSNKPPVAATSFEASGDKY